MVVYNIVYQIGVQYFSVVVIAKSITSALDLVDAAYQDNPNYNGIVDCTFVLRLHELLVEADI